MKENIVIGVSSGIAAYKVIDLIKLLKKEGYCVRVIMTNHATHMIKQEEFEKVSGEKVYRDLFSKDFDYKEILGRRSVDHIDLADSADLFLVVPATANVISKIAHGASDDFLTTTLLAATCPIAIVPSMNVHMWQNSAVQENVSILKKRGIRILGPDHGMLACGYTGEGRLMDVKKMFEEISSILKKSKLLNGKKILVTVGGTIEKIDDVRVITNKSSGKMGISIAEECYLSGASVKILRANSSVYPSLPIEYETFETADDLLKLLQERIKNFDILFHVAAVSDFSVKGQKGKIKSGKNLLLELSPQIKIIEQVRKINPKIKLIGFAAEWNLPEEELIKKGREKLAKTQSDCIVVNDVGKREQGFESDNNEVFVVFKNGNSQKISLRSKREIAEKLIQIVSNEVFV